LTTHTAWDKIKKMSNYKVNESVKLFLMRELIRFISVNEIIERKGA